jgi:hypothetical protein
VDRGRASSASTKSREILSWIDGHVPWSGVDEPPGVYGDAAVARVARLVRELHDLTAGTPLAGDPPHCLPGP